MYILKFFQTFTLYSQFKLCIEKHIHTVHTKTYIQTYLKKIKMK